MGERGENAKHRERERGIKYIIIGLQSDEQ